MTAVGQRNCVVFPFPGFTPSSMAAALTKVTQGPDECLETWEDIVVVTVCEWRVLQAISGWGQIC